MLWFVIYIGYLAMALCLAILVAPTIVRHIIDFLSIGSRLYLAGLLRLVVGIMLLFLATQSRLWGYVVILGILAAAAGLSCFFFALRRTKKILSRLRNQSNLILRIYAILGLVIWAVLVYALLPELPGFLQG